MTEEKDQKPDWYVEKGKEKRCPRCMTRLTLYETEIGELKLWCYTCQAPYVAQAWEIPDETGLP